MLAKKSFSRLGDRSMGRLATGIEGSLVMSGSSITCIVENLSRKGCRLHVNEPPRIGSTVVLRVERVDALGYVVWVRGPKCGVAFDAAVPVEAIDRVRWAVEHSQTNEKRKINSGSANWR
jgi:PilZ domain